MANLSMLGVSLEACLKVKLLQSIIKTNPFTCSSGSSIMASKERSMARKISTSVYLGMGRGDLVRKGAQPQRWRSSEYFPFVQSLNQRVQMCTQKSLKLENPQKLH